MRLRLRVSLVARMAFALCALGSVSLVVAAVLAGLPRVSTATTSPAVLVAALAASGSSPRYRAGRRCAN